MLLPHLGSSDVEIEKVWGVRFDTQEQSLEGPKSLISLRLRSRSLGFLDLIYEIPEKY